MPNNTKDTIIGVIAFSLFAVMLAYGFVKDIDHTWDRNLEIAEQAREEQRQMAEQAHEQYISPADEFLIELMERNRNHEKGATQ